MVYTLYLGTWNLAGFNDIDDGDNRDMDDADNKYVLVNGSAQVIRPFKLVTLCLFANLPAPR